MMITKYDNISISVLNFHNKRLAIL